MRGVGREVVSHCMRHALRSSELWAVITQRPLTCILCAP